MNNAQRLQQCLGPRWVCLQVIHREVVYLVAHETTARGDRGWFGQACPTRTFRAAQLQPGRCTLADWQRAARCELPSLARRLAREGIRLIGPAPKHAPVLHDEQFRLWRSYGLITRAVVDHE